jgi:hypothetical protein
MKEESARRLGKNRIKQNRIKKAGESLSPDEETNL